MTKTKEDIQRLNNENTDLNKNNFELADEKLGQVAGGSSNFDSLEGITTTEASTGFYYNGINYLPTRIYTNDTNGTRCEIYAAPGTMVLIPCSK